MCVCVCVCVCGVRMCVCAYVCMCVRVYACVYITVPCITHAFAYTNACMRTYTIIVHVPERVHPSYMASKHVRDRDHGFETWLTSVPNGPPFDFM